MRIAVLSLLCIYYSPLSLPSPFLPSTHGSQPGRDVGGDIGPFQFLQQTPFKLVTIGVWETGGQLFIRVVLHDDHFPKAFVGQCVDPVEPVFWFWGAGLEEKVQ